MKTIAGLSYLILGLGGHAVVAYPRPDNLLNRRAPTPDHGRAGAVRRAFQTAWEGYYEHAFPHDTLLPLTNGFEDDRCVLLRGWAFVLCIISLLTKHARNQWGLTPIDSLSTAIVMNYEEIVNQILDFIPSVDFSTTRKPNEPISLFESTIRYLGGLLSKIGRAHV